jgi:hypothetical protein
MRGGMMGMDIRHTTVMPLKQTAVAVIAFVQI